MRCGAPGCSAAHWGNQVGWGKIYPNNTLNVHMVGAPASQVDLGPVVASPYPNYATKAPAPPCTYWRSGAGDTWCMFPFCPVAEPAWDPLPRPLLPRFAPTWDVSRSTIIQPCNSSGYMDSKTAAAFGIISFDYNNGRAVWEKQAAPQCEEMSVEQCRRVKAVRNDTKCWVYRNTELAFAALTTDRKLMREENASLFIHMNKSACAAAPACPPKAGHGQDKGYCCPFGQVCKPQEKKSRATFSKSLSDILAHRRGGKPRLGQIHHENNGGQHEAVPVGLSRTGGVGLLGAGANIGGRWPCIALCRRLFHG